MISTAGALIKPNDKDEMAIIKKQLTVRPISSMDMGFPMPSFKVFRQKNDTLLVPQHYARKSLCAKLIEKRPEPHNLHADVKFTGELREKTRQPEAFRDVMKSWKATNGAILSLPCGYGKTTVALALACKLGLKTFIIVHKEFLLDQWVERIKEFVPEARIGRIQRDTVDVENKDFVMGMLQSVSQKAYPQEVFQQFGLVIVDEAHHICAQVFSQAFLKFCPKYTLGLSATPERLDGLTPVLHWFLGPIAFHIERTSERSTHVKVVDYENEHFKQGVPVTVRGDPCLPIMINQLCELEHRTGVIIEELMQLYKEGRQTLILSDRREHCKLLVRLLGQRHIDAALMIGGVSREEIEEGSRKRVIVATFSLAHEGLDIPTLDSLILATPKSNITQAVGRILRETKGKQFKPVVVDIKDNWGLLTAMFYKRIKVYKAHGFQMNNRPTAAASSLDGCSFM